VHPGLSLAVDAECARRLGDVIVVREDRAGVADGAEVLTRVEAERGGVAVGTGPAS
jgi:hypothetical protein